MNSRSWRCVGQACLGLCVVAFSAAADSPTPDVLPGTKPLDWPEEDLSWRMMDGAHRFVERKIAEAARRRGQYWPIDATSREAYEASMAENRRTLQEIIGAVDPRSPPRMERYGDDEAGGLAAETCAYRVFQVRWPVLQGVFAQGLCVRPKQPPAACVVVLSDADQTPEQLLGLAPGIEPANQFARRLAEQGCELLIPVLVQHAAGDVGQADSEHSADLAGMGLPAGLSHGPAHHWLRGAEGAGRRGLVS